MEKICLQKNGFYLVSLSDQICGDDDELGVTKCWYDEKTRAFEYGRHVTAWQPLPPRYKKTISKLPDAL